MRVRLIGIVPAAGKSTLQATDRGGVGYWLLERGCWHNWLASGGRTAIQVGHAAGAPILAGPAAVELEESAAGLSFTTTVALDALLALDYLSRARLLRGGALEISPGFSVRESRSEPCGELTTTLHITRASLEHLAVVKDASFPGACVWVSR